MTYDLSIVIPEGSWAKRAELVAQLEAIFASQQLVDEISFPSKMPDEHILYMLEKIMFPFYPNVKEQFLAFCAEHDYQDEPLELEVAKQFWLLMTARELASLSLSGKEEYSVVKAMYADLVQFVKKHKLSIFNPQSGELEDLENHHDFPRYYLDDNEEE